MMPSPDCHGFNLWNTKTQARLLVTSFAYEERDSLFNLQAYENREATICDCGTQQPEAGNDNNISPPPCQFVATAAARCYASPRIRHIFVEVFMKRFALVVFVIVTLAITNSWRRAEAQGSSVRAYRQTHEVEIINEFVELLSIPNVAADSVNIRRNATAIIEMMKRRGITARLLEGKGPPAVFGEIKPPGATRTIAIYAHYDGQPVDPAMWASPPFTPTLRDKAMEAGGQIIPFVKHGESYNPEWRLYARSASD